MRPPARIQLAFRAVLLVLTLSAQAETPCSNQEAADRTLIVLAAPSARDRYYRPVRGDILAFQTAYAKCILGRDNVVILGDRRTLRELARELPADILLEAPMRDIWTRDYFPVRPENPVLFRYSAAAQAGSQADADRVQASFVQLARRLGLEYRRSQWILDGGNVVDNGTNRAMVTDRFLRDNRLDRPQADAILRALLDVEHGAIIPADPEDALGHADGMVAFLAAGTVAVTRYEAGFLRPLRQALANAFPGIEIVEIDTEFVPDAFDPVFGSAMGIHVNATVTDRFIYVPVFGTGTDAAALAAIRSATDREVVPVDASKVARLGGGIRCLGAQMKGENARRLIEAARTSRFSVAPPLDNRPGSWFSRHRDTREE